MENRTKFDLNKKIEIWKLELSQNSNMTADNINELESHLRDEIDGLKLLGLNAEESLLIANKRIGNISDLATEFNKVNKGVYFRNRIIPYLKGALLFVAFITSVDLLVNLVILFTNKIGLSSTQVYDISIVFLIVLTVALLLISYTRYKTGKFRLQKLISIPMLVSLILISKVLSDFIILSFDMQLRFFSLFQINLEVYKHLFTLFVLIFSSVTYYFYRKDIKMKIVE